MRIRNTSRWDTRDLRRIVYAVAKHEGMSAEYRKLLRVEFVDGRRRLHGLGSYGAAWIRVTLRPLGQDAAEVAALVSHEIAHNQGVRHRQMSGAMLLCDPAPWQRIVGNPIVRLKPIKVLAPVSREEVLTTKAAHAEAMAGKWDRKAATATRRAAKWRRAASRYARQLSKAAGEVM